MFDFPNNPVVNQSVTAPNGGFFIWDGIKWTNGAGPAPTLYLPISGGTMSGPLTLSGNATQPLHAVPLQQLNSAMAGGPFLPMAGGTMQGSLNVTATGGNTVRSVQDRFADAVNIMDYGAKGDGTTNDTTALNAAMNAAQTSHSRTVLLPSKPFLLDPVTVPNGVVLQGMVPGPLDPAPGFLTGTLGATLLINSHATPFITLQQSSGLRDVIIHDPGQVAPTATAPNVFPQVVLMSSPSRMRGVTICNAYDAIFIRNGRCIVEDCYVGAYHCCVDTDASADVTYLNNIWCGAFYDTSVGLFPFQNMDNWVLANNGIAFKFGRADAVSMSGCGCYIKWCGLYMSDGAAGGNTSTSYGWCSGFNADDVIYGAIIYSDNSSVGWNFTNLTILPNQGTAQAATPIYMPAGGAVQPAVTWTGGGNGMSNYWANPQPIVNNGTLRVSNVAGVAASGGTINGNLLIAGNLSIANGQWLALDDAAGANALLGVGPDNNMVWYGSNASGATRVIASMYMHSSTSVWTWGAPVQFNGNVGFNSTAPISKVTVTGAKGSNAALASLINALSMYGLVTDSTTA
jgi:hypothetical protein